jgi:hypothetical protein
MDKVTRISRLSAMSIRRRLRSAGYDGPQLRLIEQEADRHYSRGLDRYRRDYGMLASDIAASRQGDMDRAEYLAQWI